MAIYLIDFENVDMSGFIGLEQLGAADKLIVFYSRNADKISIKIHEKLCKAKVKTEFIEAHVGNKNSLDFQLVTYLGALVEANKNEKFYIVSKDSGYNCVVTFWSERNVDINQVNNLSGQNKNTIESELRKLLPDFKADITKISSIIMQYKSKQGINNALVKEYKSEKAGKVYKAIKPLLGDKKGK